MKKNIDKTFLEKIQKIDLRGIKFSELNNKIVPIVSGATLMKWWAERLKVLLYIAKLIAENKPKKIKEIVFYLENSIWKKIETLKIINWECEREPLIKQIILDTVFPYKIEEIEKELQKDPYSIKNDDWTITNILFDFIKKVSKTTKFIFSEKQPRQIGLNITTTKKTLTDSKLTLEQLEWYFDKVYTKFIYDWFPHKSIRWFLIDAEDYYLNTENNQKIIKWLMKYLWIKNEPTTPLAIWSAFKKHKQAIQWILENIWWNLDNFTLILEDFSKKYKANWLNWNINTIFKNIFSQYSKYVVTEVNSENTDLWKEVEKEFTEFLESKKIKDDDIIKELYTIYSKEWINWIKDLI